MARLSLEERLNQIEDKISEKSFRENKGLGNEVGYYVFDYDPRAELEVRNHIAYLKDRINNGNKDFKIIEFDLFHTMIQVLEEEGYLEAFFDLEKDNGFFDMADSLVETCLLYTSEQKIFEEYVEAVRKVDVSLQEQYQKYIDEMGKDTKLFMELLDRVFAPDIHVVFEGSIDLAKLCGVPVDEILDSKEKTSYFTD